MVQKKSDAGPKRRGRPRAFDPETALLQIRDAFWRSGYTGTSLDEIAAATGMNRPSLYAAFGDKHALYLQALAKYWQISLSALRAPLAEGATLREALMLAYDSALSIFFSNEGTARGCFVVGTALTEALEDSEIQQSLAEGVREFDASFSARFQQAIAAGELTGDADPVVLGMLASATMHSIAVRARAGATRSELRQFAQKAIEVICA